MFHLQLRTDKESRGWQGVSVECVATLCLLLLLSGCWPGRRDNPEPPQAAVSIVVLYDTKAADDLGVYADKELDSYAESHGFQLRIHATETVDESGKPPKYLQPYLEFAQGKKTPLVMIGGNGKVRDSMERPVDCQAVIALVEKAAGDPERASDAIWAGGQWRKLASLKPCRPGAASRWPVEGATSQEPLIPEKDWRDVSILNYSKRIADQGSYSSCCPTSGCSALEMFANRSGLKPVRLSAADAYWRINDGRDSGAMLEDFWSIAGSEGVCTTDFCQEQTGRSPSHKDGFRSDRGKHRSLRVTYCDGWEAMASAIQRRKPVHFGLMVTSQFSANSQGVIGPKRSRGGGGHAVLAIGMKKIGGEWYIVMQNSWGERWGGSLDGSVPKGCCLLHTSWIEPAFGCFALAAIVSPSDDPIAVRPRKPITETLYAKDIQWKPLLALSP
jgi:hypothetical protein